jgi:hypothetical protein
MIHAMMRPHQRVWIHSAPVVPVAARDLFLRRRIVTFPGTTTVPDASGPARAGTPPVPPAEVERPCLGKILKHLALSLLMANVIPAVLFNLCLRTGNVWTALIAALVWCYGVIAWRLGTKRRTSGLLLVTVIGLTRAAAPSSTSSSRPSTTAWLRRSSCSRWRRLGRSWPASPAISTR